MHSTISSRTQTPTAATTTTTTTSSDPALPEITELLRAAHSNELCAEATSVLAGACAGFQAGALRELLSGLPAEVPLSVLCWKLADALVAHNVVSSAVWNDLLHVIKFDPRLAGGQFNHLAQCARCLDILKVTDVTVWSELVGLPPRQSPGELVYWGAHIAAPMARAGMEQPVLWDTLIAAMVDVHAGSQSAHLQVAQSLDRGIAVGGGAAWTALWRHFEASDPHDGPQLMPTVQMFVRNLVDSPDELARLVSLVTRVARGSVATGPRG